MVRLPDLVPGQIYRRDDITEYIAPQGHPEVEQTNDYDCVVRKLNTFRLGRSDRATWRPGEEVVVEYHLYPMSRFESHLAAVWHNQKTPDDEQRIATIKELFLAGAVALPVWIDVRFVNDDPIRIAEGNHRLRAFVELGLTEVPVFVCRHA